MTRYPLWHIIDDGNEDVEECDYEECVRYGPRFMDEKYPRFEPQIIHTPTKDYFLPALKVLTYMRGAFYSPSRASVWNDGELKAKCGRSEISASVWKAQYLEEEFPKPEEHDAPESDCSCGIYASVNLEEIQGYIPSRYGNYQYLNFEQSLRPASLCIVEPYPHAKVILSRKGWRASHVFISEIVGTTVNAEFTNSLLSYAWHRDIDIRRIKNENR